VRHQQLREPHPTELGGLSLRERELKSFSPVALQDGRAKASGPLTARPTSAAEKTSAAHSLL